MRGPSLKDRLKWQGTLSLTHLVIPSELKRSWKAVATEVAEKDRAGTALAFRWPLTQEERREIKERFTDARRIRAEETAEIAVGAGMRKVAQLIDSCFESALAPGTVKIYRRVQKEFLDFIRRFGVPVSALHKLRNVYVAHLIEKERLKSLGCHVAALAHFFGPLPSEDEEILRALLRGAKRTTSPPRHRKKATQKDVDTVIAWALQKKSFAGVAGAVMILFLFAAFLRVGELCELRVSGISRKGNDIWWLNIRRSKTDQAAQGAKVAFRLGEQALILWSVFENLLPPSSEQYIFSRTSKAPSRDVVARRIKGILDQAGLQHRKLTTHSFRGGAATTAIRSGLHSANIMRAGRWRSTEAFFCYIDLSPL
ncbi:unnamed protein product [Cylicocyclus nassatus]|uniref:Tyr recombinase domain-containing protein n=1 Tax=Cylicocyclus nassatus TaxID=53992 RepID=A0AA36GS10_CYLNA|nr:unnamed protein product [Cylicocyclus nassatus]